MAEAVPAAMLATLGHRGGVGPWTWASGAVGVGVDHRVTTEESREERRPLRAATAEVVLVADARLDNRRELLGELADELATAVGLAGGPTTDSALLLAAYLRWGESCVDRICGDFAFVVWDGRTRTFFCARDPFGVRPLFYRSGPRGRFACASEIKALLTLPDLPRDLDEVRVGLFLAGVFEDQARTFFQGVSRLPAGHFMVVSEDGECRVRRYFDLEPMGSIRLGSDAEYAEAFLEVFQEAVRCRIRSTTPVMATLSGGLDSTSIACVARDLLREQGREELHTVSAVFPSFTGKEGARIDERAFVADALLGGGMKPHYVEGDTISPLVDLDRILELQDEPILAPNFYLHWSMYQVAQEAGAGVFLDGLDGDTTVCHGYDYLFDHLLGLRPVRLWQEARALATHTRAQRYGTRRLVKELALGPLRDAVAHPFRRLFGRTDPRPWGEMPLLDPAFAARIELRDRVAALRGDPPRPVVGGQANHRLGLLSPLIPYALEVADRGTLSHGLEGRYPFCDRRLAEFCLALPGSQKLCRGKTRAVLRNAMAGILPASVQHRTTKADLSPSLFHGLWRFEAETLRGMTEPGVPAAGRYLDQEALRRTVSNYAGGGGAEAFQLYGVISLQRWLASMGWGE